MSGFESLSGAHGRPVLRRGLRVDHLGDERLVLDPASGVVHTVRGAAVKALDAILSGRPAADDDVVAALVGAGIVEVRGVGRREALLLAGSAAALVASVALPSAMAAASTFTLPAGSGGGSATTTEFTLASGHRLYRLFDAAQSDLDTSFRLTVTFPTTIDVLLVGGGGPGGQPGDLESAEFFGGGGGGGEVALVSLGRVVAGTALDFTVAARATADRTAGRDTVLTIGSDSVTALGGGRGAARVGTTLTAASAGGSGGGGNASNLSGGASASGSLVLTVAGRSRSSSLVNAGGSGTASYRAAAGGGGALASGSAAASTTEGGDGGAGISLSSATSWDLTVLSGSDPTAVQNIFGSGGGGAGATAGGVSNAATGRLGGYRSSNTAAQSGSAAPLASGGGGGGGIRVLDVDSNYPSGAAGNGGSGVVWVRTIS